MSKPFKTYCETLAAVRPGFQVYLNESKAHHFLVSGAEEPEITDSDGIAEDDAEQKGLATVVPEREAQIGANLSRIVADRGYRGHNAPPEHKFKVYISGQRRGVTDAVKRDLRRRSAVEPVIGHAEFEHRTGHNFLKGSHGDAANAALAAAGYDFRRLLAGQAELWRAFSMAWLATNPNAFVFASA